jgi:23S rRNA (uracil1939-C5)-methyltransferase
VTLQPPRPWESAPLQPNRPSRSNSPPTPPTRARLPFSVGFVADVDVEKLVFRGEGMARIDGVPVFVPYAAPGDRLRVRIVETGKGFARGRIEEVLQPGASRRDRRCRHFGVCGGCQLQHVGYEEQLRAKGEFVRESLRRLGGIDWAAEIPVRHAAEYGWRSRAELQARGRHVGWFRAGTHEVVDVEECPILVPAAETFVRGLAADPPRGALHFAVGDDGVVVTGNAPVRRRVAGFDFDAPASAFFQANALLVDELVREAVGDAKGALAVDLFAGVGLFSLPLARGFRDVTAVESVRAAARQGEANAALNGVTNVRFVAEPVEQWLRGARDVKPDLLLLDPPRTGIGPDEIHAIARISPPSVVYVSCDPATLARDLKLFLALGWRLTSVVALDMFPQTYHVETVVKLAR